MNNVQRYTGTHLQQILRYGNAIHEHIRWEYEPKYQGKFLAIDETTKKAYLAYTSEEAVIEARANHLVLGFARINRQTR